MKKNLLIVGLVAVAVACSSEASNDAVSNETHDHSAHDHSAHDHGDHDHGDQASKTDFGKVAVNPDEAVSVDEMLQAFETSEGAKNEFTVKGEISQVCSKMGCWVKINQSAGDPFMVRFKDHFTIPTDTEAGTMAVLHGVAYRDTVTVEMLQHFAEDAGESEEEIAKITAPEINFGFEADGIKLLK